MSLFRPHKSNTGSTPSFTQSNKRRLMPCHSLPTLTSPPNHKHTHCTMCSIDSIEAIVKQCPLSRSKLNELCDNLIHSDCDVSGRGKHNMTPLHLAILKNDVPTVRALLALGADLNAVNDFDQTPLDMATQNLVPSRNDDLLTLLISCGCVSVENLPPPPPPPPSPPHRVSLLPHIKTPTSTATSMHMSLTSDPRSSKPPTPNYTLPRSIPKVAAMATEDQQLMTTNKTSEMIYLEMEQEIERKLDLSTSLTGDEARKLIAQQKRLKKMYREQGLSTPVSSGGISPWATPRMLPGATITHGNRCRVLTLDGGGVRGLVEVEILCELERLTGRRIRDLFDCIIGTSSGGVLALAIVHCNKPVSEMRRVYLRLKDTALAKGMSVAYSTAAYEALLKKDFGTELRMMDVTHPKVLISAVNKSTLQPKLCFFNNCFHDDYSTQLVWKVARYTSAAPLSFTECDNYMDGGLLANNPSDTGLTRLQHYYLSRGERLNISCVVSLGSGKSPTEPLGQADPELNLRSIFNLGDNIRRTNNLIKLLSQALCESEEVAKKVSSNCEAQGIPYFRFSPQLDMKVEPTESDLNKLINMIICTKIEAISNPQIARLKSLLLLEHHT